jgi:hypothetical protein
MWVIVGLSARFATSSRVYKAAGRKERYGAQIAASNIAWAREHGDAEFEEEHPGRLGRGACIG